MAMSIIGLGHGLTATAGMLSQKAQKLKQASESTELSSLSQDLVDPNVVAIAIADLVCDDDEPRKAVKLFDEMTQ